THRSWCATAPVRGRRSSARCGGTWACRPDPAPPLLAGGLGRRRRRHDLGGLLVAEEDREVGLLPAPNGVSGRGASHRALTLEDRSLLDHQVGRREVTDDLARGAQLEPGPG